MNLTPSNRPHLVQILFAIAALSLCVLPTTAQIFVPNPALTVSPELSIVEVGQTAAFNANPDGGTPGTTGFFNLAWNGNGGLGFESTRIAASYGDDKLNNGVYGAGLPDVDDATRPWINADADPGGFGGVKFDGAFNIQALGFGSRFPSRSDGAFSLQYTTDSFAAIDLEDAAQTGGLTWNTIGTLTSTTAGEFGRHLFSFDQIDNVTGVRVSVDQGGTTLTEVEAYQGFNPPLPPPDPDGVAAPTHYTNVVLGDNPIHYYRFEETHTQQPAKDQIGLAPNGDQPGTFVGGITAGQASAFPVLGNAALFDGGSGTTVDLGVPSHPGDTVTVEAWVNLSAAFPSGSFAPIAARWDGSYELDVNSNSEKANFVTRNTANEFALAESADTFTRDEWHHVVGIFDNGITTVWVDGQQGTSADTSATGTMLQDVGATMLIGSTRDSTAFNWNGLIDEVAIYNYALSASQVLAHIDAAQVPEPGSLGLALLGLVGLCGVRRRKLSALRE